MRATAVNPGEETTVEMAMEMHPGMEGPHLFRVNVPVRGAGGDGNLQLYVRAHFK